MARSSAGVLRYLNELTNNGHATQRSDQDLVQRFIASRDEAALEALLRRHGPMVLRVCQRVLQQDQDAEDVFQATFLHFTRNARSLRKQASVGSWLYGVAYNLARKSKAASARRRAREGKAAQPVPADPLDEITLREAQAALDNELARLPEKLRAPLVLCYLEGVTRDEAAVQMGCSAATLKRRLEQGRELLRERLMRHGLHLAGALFAVTLSEQPVAAALPAALRQCTLNAIWGYAAGVPLVELVTPGVVKLTHVAAAGAALGRMSWTIALLLGVSFLGGTGAWMKYAGWGNRAEPGEVLHAQTVERSQTEPNGTPLPGGALVRLGTSQLAHGDHVMALAFGADGVSLFSAGRDGTVRQWNPTNGTTIRLWGGGQERPPMEGSARRLACIAVSPDGKFVAAGEGDRDATEQHAIHIWETATGKEVVTLPGHPGGVWSVTFAPDGRVLASAGEDGFVRLWEVPAGRELRKLSGHTAPPRALAFSADGKRLVSGGGDGVVRFWDAANGADLGSRLTHPRAVTSVALSPDGQALITGCEDQVVRFWDPAQGKETQRLVQPEAVLTLALSADARVLALGGSHQVTLWDVVQHKTLRHLPAAADNVQALAVSPDGTLVASAPVRGNRIGLWDVVNRQDRAAHEGHSDLIGALQFSADGKELLSAGQDGRICRWAVEDGRLERQIDAQRQRTDAYALTADSKTLVTGDADGYVRLFDVATGRQRLHFRAHRRPIVSIAVSPGGTVLATAEATGAVVLWNARTGAVLRPLPPANVSVRILRFSPDGSQLAATATNSDVALWELATGQRLRQVSSGGQTLVAGAFSPDGTWFAAGGDQGTVHVWSVSHAKKQRDFAGHSGSVSALAFSPDGRSLAVGSWANVRLWEMASSEPRDGFIGIDGHVTALAFSPDGTTLASGNGDTSILLWDVTGLRQRGRLPAPALKPAQVQAALSNLSSDAVRAHQAVWTLAAAPQQSLPLLRDELLDGFAGKGTAAEQLRCKRALEVLEKIAAAEAEQLLNELARGNPENLVTQEARAALRRRQKSDSVPQLEAYFKTATFERLRAAVQDKLKEMVRPPRATRSPKPPPTLPEIPPLVPIIDDVDFDLP